MSIIDNHSSSLKGSSPRKTMPHPRRGGRRSLTGWSQNKRIHPALTDTSPGRGIYPNLKPPLMPNQTGRCDRDLRSEEHTSELQSRGHLVCRLLLEKKKTLPKTLK